MNKSLGQIIFESLYGVSWADCPTHEQKQYEDAAENVVDELVRMEDKVTVAAGDESVEVNVGEVLKQFKEQRK